MPIDVLVAARLPYAVNHRRVIEVTYDAIDGIAAYRRYVSLGVSELILTTDVRNTRLTLGTVSLLELLQMI